MSVIDKNYHSLLIDILHNGYRYDDPNRKGVKRLEIPSYTFRHEFKDGFPAITTKKLFYKQVITELLWFLRGDTNIKYLVDNGCNIWNKDAYKYYTECCEGVELTPLGFNAFIHDIKTKNLDELKIRSEFGNFSLGDLGPVYGAQWRSIDYYAGKDLFKVDQIKNLLKTLKNSPLGTEHIVNAWNPVEIEEMALPPCHYGFQIVVKPLSILDRINYHGGFSKIVYDEKWSNYIKDTGKIPEDVDKHRFLDELQAHKYGFELHWHQRSVDTFLGLPFNIASYATLALIIEQITSYKALAIQGDLKKVHLYDNSLDAVREQLKNDANKFDKCELKFNNQFEDWSIDDLEEWIPEGFTLEGYESYPHIKVEMLEKD